MPVVSSRVRRKVAKQAEATRGEPRKAAEISIPGELPIIPGGETVLYPAIIVPLSAENEQTLKLIDEAMAGDKTVGVFAQAAAETDLPQRLHRTGTAALITRMFRMPDGSVRALLQGLSRISIEEVTQTEPYLKAKVVPILEQPPEKSTEMEAMSRNLAALFQRVISLSPDLSEEVSLAVANISDPGRLADFASAHLNLSTQERQQVLETIAVGERVTMVTGFLNRELEILELGSKIKSQVKDEMSKGQREFYLREQLKAIQKELGEVDERAAEINEFRARIEKAQLPEEARKEAERELDRLSRMNPQAAEYAISRTYLDWIASMPWSRSTQDNMDIGQTAMILDEDHYGLEKVKERILEYLAVRKLKQDMRGPILCFVGPPGTGKTSMGHSIARAMGRKFVRLSLGGIRDEAEIRGHRRTYVGALPGRIIQSLRRADSNNPVFMLDEIDKVGADFRGDPSAALLEVLDPEQNHAFSDHYLEVPFDLSKVMFITTANLVDPIIPALRDRMEILELPGYGEAEKLNIAKGFLLPRQLKEHGLSPVQLQLTDEAVRGIIRYYTREAGVRGLERQIGAICRKVARRVAQGTAETAVVTEEHLREYLGHRRIRYEVAGEADEIGVATGLAWTESGGDVLFVEATLMQGKGSLILTGKLGEVMQESARAALSYARSRAAELGIDADFYGKTDVHIHIPAGAIPKDGPSAGVTMAVALVSALTKRPVPRAIGMTGEITLRGKVLPVGGIKEKVLAAHRAGLKTVVLPKDNENDLEEVPQYVREQLQFVLVERIDEVIGAVLKEKPGMVGATI
ncbi:MAG: endopeptidase La [Dehalococcoidia bacterium]|nr:endopeptidase La [Dehalococcoidia bacterium]